MRFGPSLLSLEPYLTQAKDKEKTKSSLYYLAFKHISQGLASKFFLNGLWIYICQVRANKEPQVEKKDRVKIDQFAARFYVRWIPLLGLEIVSHTFTTTAMLHTINTYYTCVWDAIAAAVRSISYYMYMNWYIFNMQ